VLDNAFPVNLLVERNALGGLESVSSPRLLAADSAVADPDLSGQHVTLQPTPVAVLNLHPLHAHLCHVTVLRDTPSAFWNATATHLVEVLLALPTNAHASVGGLALGARPAALCALACVLLHLTMLEHWDAAYALAWTSVDGAVFVKDAQGLQERVLADASYLRLYNSARLERVQ